MKALVQRVTRASVRVEHELVAQIGPGLLVLLGVARSDTPESAERLARKVRALRVFAGADGRMSDALGTREVLCVSQFTLLADTASGNRPGFSGAAAPQLAQELYELFCLRLDAARGRFGEHMQVELVGDGPVTILLEA